MLLISLGWQIFRLVNYRYMQAIICWSLFQNLLYENFESYEIKLIFTLKCSQLRHLEMKVFTVKEMTS